MPNQRTAKLRVEVCVYDSPHTMRRECWENGKIVYSIDAFALVQKGGTGFPIFFGANVGPWKTGQIIGNPKAMDNAVTDKTTLTYEQPTGR